MGAHDASMNAVGSTIEIAPPNSCRVEDMIDVAFRVLGGRCRRFGISEVLRVQYVAEYRYRDIQVVTV